MRRPLFWAALCLVAAAAVWLETDSPPHTLGDQISTQSLEASRELVVAGQVYQKDGSHIYLQDVIVHSQISEEYSPFQNLLSDAGDSRQSVSCKENIICKIADADSIPLGSEVVVEGVFMPFLAATNPGEFDALIYYRTQGVGGRLNQASVLAQGEGYWRVRESLYDLRVFLRGRLYRALGEKEAGVMCALLLGDKDGLEEQVEDLYRRNGILHILSISSLHVTILGMALYSVLRRLGAPVWLSAASGSILLLLYGGLTGFGVSACRAIGMYLIRMLGEVLGRTYDMLTALGFMAAVMVAANPYYLQHSGFLLSYSSVLGIGVLYPALFRKSEKSGGGRQALGRQSQGRRGLGRYSHGLQSHGRQSYSMQSHGMQSQGMQSGKTAALISRSWEGIRQSGTASLSVTLCTLPVQLWCYYEVPVYAVFINLLVLPFVKMLMLSGIILSVLPEFLPAAAMIKLILGWFELLCGWFGRLPFHTWNPGCPKLWQIVVYYLILGMAVLFSSWFSKQQERIPKGTKGRLLSIGMLASAVLLLGIRPPKENRVTFLDVGQGDCALVQTASGENYLFDCGSSSRSGVGEYVLIPYLKYNGIHILDAVFVSHPDTDHVSGILELLEMGEESGVKVWQLVLPDLAETSRKEQLGEILAAVKAGSEKMPEIRYICAGDMWESTGARFTCLHPGAGCDWEDANAYSECIYVEFYTKGSAEKGKGSTATLLLTGDVEGIGESELIEVLADRNIRQVDILKVAHHGSRGTTSEAFLEQIDPVLAVISCGKNNRYGHPHEELLERLETEGSLIISTAQSGAVEVRVKDVKVSVEVF